MLRSASHHLVCQRRLFSSSYASKSKKKLFYTAAAAFVSTTGYLGWQYYTQGPNALDPDRYVPLDLTEKEQVSPGSYRLRVAIKKQQNKTYPVPSCLFIKDDAIQVMRPYTPINANPYKDGFVDLLVKKYENGSVSRTLTAFEPQVHQVHIRGPMEEEYQYKQNSLDEVGMIAGGTGISPMYQIICRILEDPEDQKTRIWLLYGNKTLQDVLLKPELDKLQEKYSERFKVKYVLENPPKDWKDTGYVSKEMIEDIMSKDSTIRRKVFVCGPDGLLKSVSGERARDYSQGKLSGILSELNYTPEQVWKFQ
ncbi:hypothetical protein BY458DRAFT_491348 [Sporodiniella umbellata]|nr:hypothetical protein BY458DRAFT_491348 [Sporodiniella umbellata]